MKEKEYYTDAYGAQLDALIGQAESRLATAQALLQNPVPGGEIRGAAQEVSTYTAALRVLKERRSQWTAAKLAFDGETILSGMEAADAREIERLAAASAYGNTFRFGLGDTTDIHRGTFDFEADNEDKALRAALEEKYGKDFDTLYRYFRLRTTQDYEKAFRETVKSAGAAAQLLYGAASVVTNFLSAPGVLYEYARAAATGQEADTAAPGFAMQRATRNIRTAQAEGIDSEPGKMLYFTAMSGIDSYVAGATLGAGGGYLLGATAAANAMQDISERGGTVEQAIAGGVLSGVFECVFESISIGQLNAMKGQILPVAAAKDLLSASSLKTIALNIGKSAVVNFSEEAATEIANIVSDTLLMGNLSNFALSMQELVRAQMAAGLSYEQAAAAARKTAAEQLGVQVLEAGLSGALMGAAFGVIGTAASAYESMESGRGAQLMELAGQVCELNAQNAALPPQYQVGRIVLREDLTGEELARQASAIYEATARYNRDTKAQQKADPDGYAQRQAQARQAMQAKAGVQVKTVAAAADIAGAAVAGRTMARAAADAGEWTTSLDTDARRHTQRQMRTIREYLRAADEGLKAFFQKYRENPDAAFSRFTISKAGSRQAQDMARLLGGDWTGYVNAIDRNGVLHIQNRHGENGRADTSMRNLDDAARIGYILDNYDELSLVKDEQGRQVYSSGYRNRDNSPAPLLLYRKKINGSYYVVEAVPDSAYKKMWVVSAYIANTKNGSSYASVQDAAAAAPNFTPGTELPSPASASTLAQRAGAVKGEETDARRVAVDFEDESYEGQLRAQAGMVLNQLIDTYAGGQLLESAVDDEVRTLRAQGMEEQAQALLSVYAGYARDEAPLPVSGRALDDILVGEDAIYTPAQERGADGAGAQVADARFSAMYRSRAQDLGDYYSFVHENRDNPTERNKSYYALETESGVQIHIPFGAVLHIDNGHQLGKDEFASIFESIEKENIIEAAIGEAAYGRGGTPVKLRVKTPNQDAGVFMEIYKSGRATVRTAFLGNRSDLKNWIKKDGFKVLASSEKSEASSDLDNRLSMASIHRAVMESQAYAAQKEAERKGKDYGREESGNLHHGAGGQRDGGQSAAVEIRRMEGEAGRNPGADGGRDLPAGRGDESAGGAARGVHAPPRRQGQTTRQLGISRGEDRDTVFPVDESRYTSEMREAQQLAKDYGYDIRFAAGQMHVKGELGQRVGIDGAIEGNRIYVNAGSRKFTPAELTRHEIFHGILEANPKLREVLAKKVFDTMTPQQYREAFDAYEQAYAGAYDGDNMEQRICDEMLADMYAGMERVQLGLAARFGQTVRDAAAATGAGDAVRDGRFSIANTRHMSWEKQVSGYFSKNGTIKSSDSLYIGESNVKGVEKAPLYIPTSVITKAMREQKGSRSAHGLRRNEIADLQKGIETAPVIIVNPSRNAMIYVTENQDRNGNYIIAAFDMNNDLHGENAHKATSVYGRESIASLLKALGKDATIQIKNENKLNQMLPGNQIYRSLELLAKVELDAETVPQAGQDVKPRYSVAGDDAPVYDYSKSFSEQIEDFKAGKIPKNDTLLAGGTPQVLQDIGLLSLPMTVNQTHVDYAVYGTRDLNHYLSEEGLKQIPEAMKHPVAVMVSRTKPDSSIVVMLEVRQNGKQVVVPVVVDGFGRQNGVHIDSNAITSVYGRSNSIRRVLYNAIADEAEGKFSLYYLDKEKSARLLREARVTMPRSHADSSDGSTRGQLQGARVLMPKMLADLPGGVVHRVTDPASPVKRKFGDVTQTQQFKRWFGKSAVVDSRGAPLLMYHGTRAENGDFTVFDADRAVKRGGLGLKAMGKGNYFTSKKLTGKERYGSRVIAAYLRIQKPFVYQGAESFSQQAGRELGQDLSGKSFDEIQKIMKAAGYDGVVQYDSDGKVSIAVAFDSNQIKSVDNVGTFDRNNPDIRYSVADATTADEKRGEIAALEREIGEREAMLDPYSAHYQQHKDAIMALKLRRNAAAAELASQLEREAVVRSRERAKLERENGEKLSSLAETARQEDRAMRQAREQYEQTGAAMHLEAAETHRRAANEARRERNRLKAQIGEKAGKAAQGFVPRQSIRRTAGRILDLFGIQAGNRAGARAAVEDILIRTLEAGYASDAQVREVLTALYADGVAVSKPDALYEEAARFLRGKKIYVSPELKAEFSDGWAGFRRALLGAGIYAVNDKDARGVDEMYQELSDMAPGVFGAADMRGMLEDMLDAAQRGKPVHRSLAEAAKEEGISPQEDFEGLLSVVTDELARFADAAGIESAMRSDSAEKTARIVRQMQEHFEKLREDARQRREHTETMDRLRRRVKALGKLKNVNSQSLLEAIEQQSPEMQAQVRDILERLSVAANRLTKRGEFSIGNLKAAYEAWFKEHPNYPRNAAVEARIRRLDGMETLHASQLSVEQLAALVEAMDGIGRFMKTREQMATDAYNSQISDYADAIREEVAAAPRIRTRKQSARDFWGEGSLSPSRALMRLAGYDATGMMAKLVRRFEDGDIAEMDYRLRTDLIFKDFLADRKNRKWLEKASGKDADFIRAKIPNIVAWDSEANPQADGEIEIEITPMMLVQIAMDLQNEQNLRHVMYGGYDMPAMSWYKKGKYGEVYASADGKTGRRQRVMMTPAVMQGLVDGYLDGTGREYARLLTQYYDTFSKTRINGVSQMLDGFDRAVNRNYYPIRTSANYRDTSFNIFDVTIESAGMLKSRQAWARTPILLCDAEDTMNWHVDKMARYYGYAAVVRDFKAVMNEPVEAGKTLLALIAEKHGAAAQTYIEEFIARVETGYWGGKNGAKLWAARIGQYSQAVLSANPVSMLKQLGAVQLAGVELGQGAMARAMLSGPVDTELIRAYTPYYDYRADGTTIEAVSDHRNRRPVDRLPEWVRHSAGFTWLTEMDKFANRKMWHAAEYYVRSTTNLRPPKDRAAALRGDDLYYKAVAEAFNRATHATQTNYNMMSRPKILSTDVGVAMTVLMYKTDAMQMGGMIRQAWGEMNAARRRAKAGGEAARMAAAQAKGRFVRTIAGTAASSIFSGMMEALVKNLRGDDDEYRGEDGQKTGKSVSSGIAREAARNMAGCVVLGDQLADILSAVFGGDRLYAPEAPTLSSLYDAIDTLIKLGGEIGEFASYDAQYRSAHADRMFGALREAAIALSYLAGVPLRNWEKNLVGVLGRFAPEIAVGYEDWLRDFEKRDLSGKSGAALRAAMKAYLSDEAGIRDEKVVDEYLALYAEFGADALPGANAPKLMKNADGECCLPIRKHRGV